jgi:putative iron-dependent peroxidase
MALPQPGIFAVGTVSHGYVELDLVPDAGDGDGDGWVTVLADLAERETTMGATNVVVGVRPELWAAQSPGTLPDDLTGFEGDVAGADGFTMPATQHDLALWFAAASYDVVFDAVVDALSRLAPFAALASELRGWAYHRDRDLTGFEDGTENPTLGSAPAYALVADGSPGAGGSVWLLQQWSHDPAWLRLSDSEQEQAMGRTKPDSVELDPRPETSHVARSDQDTFGHILRRNAAYGTVSDHGTVFVGFAAGKEPLQRMLESMAGVGGGPRDELTRFATPLSGAYYWVPAASDLQAIATPEEDG